MSEAEVIIVVEDEEKEDDLIIGTAWIWFLS